jgi:CYTH domain-containing protein
MHLEIERRFIARASAALLARSPAIEMRQAYLTLRDPVTVRIRQEGAAWVLAVKADATGMTRHEIEVDVGEERGRALLALAAGGMVEKTRHRAGRWEIDVYSGRFAGLVLAEAELESEAEPLPAPPDGLDLIREITLESGLSSRGLARMDETEARALVTRLTGRG